jgi:hypothetical protein
VSETSAAKQVHERSLTTLTDIGPPIDRDWLASTIAELRDELESSPTATSVIAATSTRP